MDISRLLRGNDMIFDWEIFRPGKVPENFDGKSLTLMLKRLNGDNTKVENFTVDGNKITFKFFGKDQRYNGIYRLILIENNQEENMATAMRDVVELVDDPSLVTEVPSDNLKISYIHLSSTLDFDYISMSKNEIERILTGDIDSHNHHTQILQELQPYAKSEDVYSLLINALADYVRKEQGKGLSANDFTDILKAKLEGLSNYDDTDILSAIDAINQAISANTTAIGTNASAIDATNTRIDTLIGSSASEAIDNFNEIKKFLEGITDRESLVGLLNNLRVEIEAQIPDISGKLDKSVYDANKTATDAEIAKKLNKTVYDANKVETDNAIENLNRDKIEDAPADNEQYVRLNHDWAKAMPIEPKGGYNRKVFENLGARYHPLTDDWELNGEYGISSNELDIILHRSPRNIGLSGCSNYRQKTNFGRLLKGQRYYNYGAVPDLTYFLSNSSCDTFDMGSISVEGSPRFLFAYQDIKKIIGIIDFHLISSLSRDAFTNAFSLQLIFLENVNFNIDLHWCNKLMWETLSYVVEHSANKNPITLSLNSLIYNLLNGVGYSSDLVNNTRCKIPILVNSEAKEINDNLVRDVTQQQWLDLNQRAKDKQIVFADGGTN